MGKAKAKPQPKGSGGQSIEIVLSIGGVLGVPISASGFGPAYTGLGFYTHICGLLGVTAGVPAGGTPTLDVYVQSSCDGGATWTDILHTQFTTVAVARPFQISGDTAGATTIAANKDAALAGETVVQGAWGSQLRLKWVFAAGGSTGGYALTCNLTLK